MTSLRVVRPDCYPPSYLLFTRCDVMGSRISQQVAVTTRSNPRPTHTWREMPVEPAFVDLRGVWMHQRVRWFL